MKEEIRLAEAFLKNRWGRDQKIKPGDKVRLAPLEIKKPDFSRENHHDFLHLMTEGLSANQLYTVNRIGQFPDDETVILYLDLGGGQESGYYAEYLQAVDERKIKVVEFPFKNPKDVARHLKTITQKASRIIHYTFQPKEMVHEEAHASNEWVILPAADGKCKVTMDGEPREVKLNPDKVIVIPVPAGKRHSIVPLSGFSSYMVLYEGNH